MNHFFPESFDIPVYIPRSKEDKEDRATNISAFFAKVPRHRRDSKPCLREILMRHGLVQQRERKSSIAVDTPACKTDFSHKSFHL
jgi:hypothetical protein